MSLITPEMVFSMFVGACLLITVIFHERRKSRDQQMNRKEDIQSKPL